MSTKKLTKAEIIGKKAGSGVAIGKLFDALKNSKPSDYNYIYVGGKNTPKAGQIYKLFGKQSY
jgi:hypothetical protein